MKFDICCGKWEEFEKKLLKLVKIKYIYGSEENVKNKIKYKKIRKFV